MLGWAEGAWWLVDAIRDRRPLELDSELGLLCTGARVSYVPTYQW
jgi:hypothetical protein